jgi:hypothetical protein
MKKTLVVAAGLAVLSTSAFASKARMAALNQDSGLGSYYMEDERNAFRMAGSFSGNYAYLEHGTNGAAGDAEGGFFREGNSMSYGLYLNSSEHGQLASSSTGAAPARLDLFLRSNSGMNWGVRLGYETINIDATDEDGSAFDLSVNGELAGANVWFTYVPATDTLSGSAGNEADMSLGATYGYGDHTLFAEYSSEGGVDGADAEATIRVGAGRTMSTDSGMFFYDVTLESISNEGNDEDVSKLALPVTFGFESQATSWLTWRASIQQSLFGSRDTDGDKSSARTTTVGAGASLTWGNLRIDGTLAGIVNTSAADTTTTRTTTTTDGSDATTDTTTETVSVDGNRLGLNNLMANISAVYTF